MMKKIGMKEWKTGKLSLMRTKNAFEHIKCTLPFEVNKKKKI